MTLPQSLKDASLAENGRYCSGYLDGERAFCEATFNHAVQWLYDHLMKSELEFDEESANSKGYEHSEESWQYFTEGARWQFEQDKAKIAALEAERNYCTHPGCGCVCGHKGKCPEDGPIAFGGTLE